MKHLLNEARHEILNLRRANEILSAKVEVMELFACVLHTKPAMHDQKMAPDVAWALQKAIDAMQDEAAVTTSFDRGGQRNENNEGDLVNN